MVSISALVNQEHVKQLIDKGFSKNVAEKAIFKAKGSGV